MDLAIGPMSASPAISVLMLSHNHVRFTDEVMQSVLAQRWSDWEMVVVDNQSADGSWELIQQCARNEPRINPIRPDQRLSIAGALNLGVRHARGRYIAPIDSDDTWLPQRLERQMGFMEGAGNPDVGVCGSNCLLINAEGHAFATKDYPQSHAGCVRAFWYRNPICHSAALIRKECFERLGAYEEAFDLAQDLALWFRLGQRYRLANLPEYLTRVRIWGANATLRRHREIIAVTLRARRRALSQYGYHAGLAGQVAMAATWLMQWLPARLVRQVFNHLFLPGCTFLWRDVEVVERQARPGPAGKSAPRANTVPHS